MTNTTGSSPFGHALRRWRLARRLSQLELATRAGTPARHVSFLETGRSRPSREMVLRLAGAIDVPLHERNALLAVAGFGPAFAQRTLDDAALGPVRFVIERLLAAHAPYPGIVLDRWYDILDANVAAQRLLNGGRPIDRDDPPNLIELMLGPLKEVVLNGDDLALDALARLRRDVAAAPDDGRLAGLLERVEAATRRVPARPNEPLPSESVVLLTRVRLGGVELTTHSTFVYFGSTHDVTVDGLHLELMYPADDVTDRAFRVLGTTDPGPA